MFLPINKKTYCIETDEVQKPNYRSDTGDTTSGCRPESPR